MKTYHLESELDSELCSRVDFKSFIKELSANYHETEVSLISFATDLREKIQIPSSFAFFYDGSSINRFLSQGPFHHPSVFAFEFEPAECSLENFKLLAQGRMKSPFEIVHLAEGSKANWQLSLDDAAQRVTASTTLESTLDHTVKTLIDSEKRMHLSNSTEPLDNSVISRLELSDNQGLKDLLRSRAIIEIENSPELFLRNAITSIRGSKVANPD